MRHIINGGHGTSKRWKAAIPIITATAVVAVAALLTSGKEARHGEADALRLAKEELLGEKLQLEKRLAELERERSEAHARLYDADQRILDLEQLLASARGSGRPATADASSSKLKRELAAAALDQERLQRELDAARGGQRSLQEQLDALRADRDALAARLSQRQQGARMVNNAAVDAVRGKRQQLTVRARRAREIRMAFDLPEDIAPTASFRMVSPSGRVHEGGGPSLSVVSSHDADGSLAARFMLAGGTANDRTARVHLRFKPEKRLEPGTYRIDISSGGLYLNTVMLNLR